MPGGRSSGPRRSAAVLRLPRGAPARSSPRPRAATVPRARCQPAHAPISAPGCPSPGAPRAPGDAGAGRGPTAPRLGPAPFPESSPGPPADRSADASERPPRRPAGAARAGPRAAPRRPPSAALARPPRAALPVVNPPGDSYTGASSRALSRPCRTPRLSTCPRARTVDSGVDEAWRARGPHGGSAAPERRSSTPLGARRATFWIPVDDCRVSHRSSTARSRSPTPLAPSQDACTRRLARHRHPLIHNSAAPLLRRRILFSWRRGT